MNDGDYDDDVEPGYIGLDVGRVEGGWRDVTLGVGVMLSVGIESGCCFVGAWTIGRWIWRLG